MNKLTKKERFEEKVLSRYHVYNSVFATLPYDLISDTGQLLPILTAMCKNGFKNKSQPLEIIDNFFSKRIPICGVLGGGYNKDFNKLIELHSSLHKTCAKYI